MKISVFAPYSQIGQESGVIYLLAGYLAHRGYDVTQLICNGVFPNCLVDFVVDNVDREINCLKCKSVQSKIVKRLASIKLIRISRFILPEESQQIFRWSKEVSNKQIEEIYYSNLPVGKILLEAINRSEYIIKEEVFQDKKALEAQLVSVVYSLLGAERAIRELNCNLHLVSDSNDVVSQGFIWQLNKLKKKKVLFSWRSGSRRIDINLDGSNANISCEVFSNLDQIRSEVDTWPKELIKILQDIVNYIGIEASQLALPIKRADFIAIGT